MSAPREDEFLQALARLEAFEHAKPSRRYLVAIDNAIDKLSAFVLAVESVGEAQFVTESVALVEGLKKERARMAELLKRELN
ncbi:MAG TPA: hypothetical protein VJ011_03885 [Steroidobacteraceae bacterium]|nr:hypothetical protein [Steroidobacteraceae bacterium]